MTEFRLLAVKPLRGCSLDFRKVLKENEIYSFYNNFKFKVKDGDVVGITHTKTVPDDLYHADAPGSPAINISAVVGKNGSGKSTLAELFFAAIYVKSVDQNVLFPNLQSLEVELKKLEEENNRGGAVDYKIRKDEISERVRAIKEIRSQVKVEIFYSISDTIYSLKMSGRSNLSAKIWLPKSRYSKGVEYTGKRIDIPDTEEFCYTIAVNYSLHGLNSNHMGRWIENLFHKNDGYRTPLVINPFRENGNIDVNIENHLAQSRLIANLVDDSMQVKNIIENKSVEKIRFSLDIHKLNEFRGISLKNIVATLLEQSSLSEVQIFSKLYKSLLNEKLDVAKKRKEIRHFDAIVTYSIKKLFKIAHTYPEYRSYSEMPTRGLPIPRLRDIDGFLEKLGKDRSHLTLKLKQILNTVRFNLLKETKEQKWRNGYIELPVKEFVKRISSVRKAYGDIEPVELIPAAFFIPSLYVKNNERAKNSAAGLQILSSGEQQFIHTIQSILYHLTNVNSVFGSRQRKGKAYRFVNILLDEIELYFHPEFQQKFIKELLSGISQLNISEIKGINILLCTHSPFILSDIPNANLLRLDNGNIFTLENQQETFGSNIHELLHNDFFLNDGFTGKWSREYILNLIESLNSIKDSSITSTQLDHYKSKISVVGEPFVKTKLYELLKTKEKNKRAPTVQDIIDEKMKEIEELRKMQ